MKRSHGMLLLMMLLIAALLCGCAQNAPANEPAAPSEAAPAEETTAPAQASVPQDEVQNNGGFFLGLGKLVVYREYPVAAFPESALWGDFLTTPDTTVDLSLRVYDSAAHIFTAEIADNGVGRLWYANGRIWTQRLDDGEYRVYTLMPDGSERKDVTFGTVQGVSQDGTLVCIQGSEPGKLHDRLTLWKDGEQVASVEPAEHEILTYCGFAGDAVLYTAERIGESVAEIRQFDASGKTLTLGKTPVVDEMEGLYAPEFEQLIVDGNDAYLLFAWYQGTGHFYYTARALKVRLGAENSAEDFPLPVSEPAPEGSVDKPPVLFLADPGDVVVVPEKNDVVRLSEGDCGSLDFYDSPFSAIQLIPDFISEFNADLGGKVIQTAEVVGDDAYLMLADCERDAVSDIGWRYAYSLKELSYLRVPLRQNSAAEPLVAPQG